MRQQIHCCFWSTRCPPLSATFLGHVIFAALFARNGDCSVRRFTVWQCKGRSMMAQWTVARNGQSRRASEAASGQTRSSTHVPHEQSDRPPVRARFHRVVEHQAAMDLRILIATRILAHQINPVYPQLSFIAGRRN
jgi:hypothetical protein